MRGWFAILSAVSLLVACSAPPAPTPDLVATHVVAMRAAAATVTAEAPTATTAAELNSSTEDRDTSTSTAPTPDLVATVLLVMRAAAATLTAEAPTATDTPAPTNTPEPTAAPSATPQPTQKPKPQSTKAPALTSTPAPRLNLTFRDPHYECEMTSLYSRADDRDYWGYRSFQALMVLENHSNKTVEPPWKPSRWIIAHWRNPADWRENASIWEWRQAGKNWEEPPIPPGGTGRWTYVAFPIHRWEFVKAAEFDWQGQTYRFEFPRPEYSGQDNFVDCGPYPDIGKPSGAAPADIDNPTP